MLRIRFHGRGGQGMKTAGRILGTAFFLEGFEVQDAPRYGAERRGAPIFAYVRASREPINERGVIRRPDLVIVADDTLMPLPAAGVAAGADGHTVLLAKSRETSATWKKRLGFPGPVVSLPAKTDTTDPAEQTLAGATCTGAAARLTGLVSREAVAGAMRHELGFLDEKVLQMNLDNALWAYDLMAPHEGRVTQAADGPAVGYPKPDWIDMPFDGARLAAPAIHVPATSVDVNTGLWRTMRPVLDRRRCNRCVWICAGFCPDGVITDDDEGYPRIDYDHCKGCLICVAQCRVHAMGAVPENEATAPGRPEGDRA
jgi:pyruvate ferredoxin oxidoreductase gamma subunit